MVNIISLILFISCIFQIIKSEIINNPIKAINQSNPIDFYISFTNYCARTIHALNEIKITQEIDPVKFDGLSYIYSPNLFHCSSQNNRYLYADYKLYTITENENGISSVITNKSIPNNCIYFGYIKERYEEPSNNTDQICDFYTDEMILYGIQDKSIFFYYIEEEQIYEVSLDYLINTISCKLRNSGLYLCAIDQNDKAYAIRLTYTCLKSGIKRFRKEKRLEIPIVDNSITLYYNKLILYDSQKDHYKI